MSSLIKSKAEALPDMIRATLRSQGRIYAVLTLMVLTSVY